MDKCNHEDFNVKCNVSRIEDVGRFMLDVKVSCTQCGVPMKFLGLPQGLDFNGASTEVGAKEARLAIHPEGEAVPSNPSGYVVRGPFEG